MPDDHHHQVPTEEIPTVCVPAKQRRLCRFPGCPRVIKSQGHCQRHGAKAKRCRVKGCDKQAQGTHEGMCKRHWKATHFPEEVEPPQPHPPAAAAAPAAQGVSVYDHVLPQSIAYRPVKIKEDDAEVAVMPLVTFLQEGRHLPAGWHRNQERTARGLPLVQTLSTQLEGWERQLVRIVGCMNNSMVLVVD